MLFMAKTRVSSVLERSFVLSEALFVCQRSGDFCADKQIDGQI